MWRIKKLEKDFSTYFEMIKTKENNNQINDANENASQAANHANENADACWQQCLDIIKDNVDLQVYNTWFLPIKAKSWENDKLTIQIPSQWYQEWIEEHYYKLLNITIKRVLGESAKLFYEIIVIDNVEVEPAKINSPAFKYPPVSSQIDKQHTNQVLNPRYAFESYVVGDSNQLAVSAAKSVANESDGTRFNPFFIYGGSGLGKTHLAQAIGNYILRNNPAKRLLYVSSEKFTMDFVEQATSNDNKKKANFNHIYRNVDFLIVEDIQFLSGKASTQDKFFHIFNSLYLEGKQIVLTADRPPKDIKDIDNRLISRFIAGLNVEIRQPDLHLRKEIIKRKSSDEGIILSEEIIEYIAKNVTKSVREIEGTLIKIIAMTTFDHKTLNLELVQEIVTGLASEPKPLTVEEIKEKISLHYNIRVEVMISKSRKHEIALARQMAMYFSRKLTNNSLKSIGDSFGGRDHATVLHSCQAIENYLDTDKKIKAEFELLESILTYR